MIVDPLLTFTAQLFLALLLIGTGLHKSADLARLQAVISAYRVVPTFGVRAVAWLVVGVELIVGAALMVPTLGPSAALAAAGVFTVYLIVIGLSLVRGQREMDCGCSLHGRAAPLSGAHLMRNGALVLWALMASMPDSARVIGWLDEIQIAAAVVSLVFIYLSADSLLAHNANELSLEA